MRLKFIGREKYTTGTIDISEPWRNTNGKDIFIYELCSEKNDGLKSTIEIISCFVILKSIKLPPYFFISTIVSLSSANIFSAVIA